MSQGEKIRVLDLPLKAVWYDMIESGVKQEEYRELTPYWAKRFLRDFPVTLRVIMDIAITVADFTPFHGKELHPVYTHVRFRYGYTRRTMLRRLDCITIGRGRTEWGAPTDRDVFRLHLSECDILTTTKTTNDN